MPKPKKPTPVPIAIPMSDEEFQELHRKKEKEAILKQLTAAANGSFSVKNLNPTKPKDIATVSPIRTPSLSDDTPSGTNHPARTELTVDDQDWDAILNLASEFEPLSPIHEVTRRELGDFRLSDAGLKEKDGEPHHYKDLFKKEQAMFSEILLDVTSQAKWANDKLKDMTKKSAGYAGVAKTYPDLISAANALNRTRYDIISKMADLKKTVVDFEMKRAKEVGPEENNLDNIADQFFSSIIGNRKEFMETAMSNAGYGNPNPQAPPNLPPKGGYDDAENISFDGGYSDNSQIGMPRMRSITSPLYAPDNESITPVEDNDTFDPYGYIRNESMDISICIQRFPDGRLEFVAVDANGDGVDNYELPDEDLLLSLEIRPLSNFATDEFGRRYRIIDIDADGIDISDV